MIKDSGGKFDDYSISPKIRKILLHYGFKLTERNFFLTYKNELLSITLTNKKFHKK